MFTNYCDTAHCSAVSSALPILAAFQPLPARHASARSGQRPGRRLFANIVVGFAIAAAGTFGLAPLSAQAQKPGGLPAKLEFDARPITFRNGVPVGGRSHLTLYPDGHYHFSGHFHVSGAPSYNVGITWMVRTPAGAGFLFPKKGHLHGTFESGSRDCNWDSSGVNEDVKRSWADLAAAGSRAEWRAKVNIDIGNLITEVKQAVEVGGQIVKVIQVVTP